MNTDVVNVDEQLAKDVAAHQAKQQHTRRANAEPLPGPLSQAFTLEEMQVFGFTLRPVVAGDFILLKKLNSPLYRHVFALDEHARKIKAGEIPENAPPPKSDYDEEECVEMIFQFTRPISEVRAALRSGREAFRETAHAAILDRVPAARLDVFPRLVATVVENFTAAFSTAVQYGAPDKAEEQTVFTTRPGVEATASAGGLTTSPGSAVEIPPANRS